MNCMHEHYHIGEYIENSQNGRVFLGYCRCELMDRVAGHHGG